MTQPNPPAVDVAAVRARLDQEATWCVDYQPFGIGGPAGNDGYKACKKCERSRRSHDIAALLAALDQQQREIERLQKNEHAYKETFRADVQQIDGLTKTVERLTADLAAAKAANQAVMADWSKAVDELVAAKAALAQAEQAQRVLAIDVARLVAEMDRLRTPCYCCQSGCSDGCRCKTETSDGE
jgi:hypothetical protein